jgi:ATP-dependent Lon protease
MDNSKQVTFSSYFENIPNSSDDSDYEPSLDSTAMYQEELRLDQELENEEDRVLTTEEEEEEEEDRVLTTGEEEEEDLVLTTGEDELTDLLKSRLLASLIGSIAHVGDESSDDEDGEQGVMLTPTNKTQLSTIKQLLRDERPTVPTMMKMDIPIRVKKELFERIKVLEGIPKYTEEYITTKNTINRVLQEYSESDLKVNQYAIYDKQEDVLRKERKYCTPLKYRILSSDQPQNVKRILYEKFHTLNQLVHGDSNYGKLSEWIDCVMKLPVGGAHLNLHTKKERIKMIRVVQTHLDSKLYGMKQVKEEILCCVNDYITNRGDSNQGLALVGSPGIGKTSIIRTLAECLDVPFYQISLGGAKDSSFLKGHGYTYEGAKPGAIVEALIRMKSNRGIIFFDEFDKIADTAGGMELVNALLHIIDPTQNMDFRDLYMPEVPIDLSNIWFMYSMNSAKHVNSILRDRIPVLHVPDFSQQDKVEIVKRFIFPNALKRYEYEESQISLSEDSIDHLIEKTRDEKGVRELTRSMGVIIKRLHFLKSCSSKNGLDDISVSFKLKKNQNNSKKIIIDKDLMDVLLKNPKPVNLSFMNMYM